MPALCRRSLVGVLCAAGIWPLHWPKASAQSVSDGWSEEWLLGSILRLVDETRVEELRFASEGVVAITSGKHGGPLTGPLMKWRIHNGKLEIGYPDSYDALELLSIAGANVVVKRKSGDKAVFEVQRP
jgi:hypothetical protein